MAARGARNQRVFEALPPARGSRAPFAESWWGRAWVAALEQSSLDAGRLQRGRTYARRGAVGQVTVAPGHLTARVQGSRTRPYRCDVAVEQLPDPAWEHLLDVIAERAANIAALLDGDMPPGLADDAAAAGVTLLPGPGDLDPGCSCPDWGYPCKHAAAVCYQVARLLDRDPFVLLLLRGRGESEIVEELHRRNAVRLAAAVPAERRRRPAGDRAGEAYAREPAPLPPAPRPPDRPGRGPALVGAAEPEPGLDPGGLELVAADAALRARQLLAAAVGPHHAQDAPAAPLSAWQDAVRLAASHTGEEVFFRVAAACGRPPLELAAAVRAWRHGGAAALTVLEEGWDPPADLLAHGRNAVREDWPADPPPRLRTARNRLTVLGRLTASGRNAQLRLGRDDLRWYPYAREDGAWWPSGPPDSDPVVALSTLLALG